MKLKKILPAIVILIIAAIIVGCSGTRNIKADLPLDGTAIKNMIDSPSFIFIPRFVTPWNGRRRDLTPGYEISVSKDTIKSYLPFFGRGYTAPVSPADVDFDFTSTKFSYKVTPVRRGWNISIKTLNQTSLRELYFRIFDDGTGSLNITSMDRSAVSYDGYLSRRTLYKEEKK